MSEKPNVIPPEEIDFHVQSLRKFQLEDIGSMHWMDQHEILLKLHQQSTHEITSYQEEIVKELIIAENKLPILVHELYTLLIWRAKILPRLMKIDSNPKASFILYTVFFHEASAISLVENVLYHQSGYEALHDTVLDLIDYCVQAITQLIGLVSIGHSSSTRDMLDENCGQDLERQKRDILYRIGMRSLVILSYVADKSDASSISTFRRLVQTHDTLCLLSEILHCKPWLRRTDRGVEKFIDDSWQTVTGIDLMKVSKVEAQTWFCLRQILFNGNISNMYAITEFRQRELAKCVALMSDTLLDQLPPLIELKHYLCALTVSGKQTSNSSSTIMMEEMPTIKEEIIRKAKQTGYQEISEKQAKIFLNAEPDNIFAIAKRLQSAYNIDYLANYEETVKEAKQTNQCGKCKKIATKKCSKCERVYYCSRDCQVSEWSSHKIECQAN